MQSRLVRRLIAACLVFVLPAAAGATMLHDARLWASADKTRVVFDLSSDVQPDIFMLDDPHRLVVDLPRTRTRDNVALAHPDSGLIEQIRTGVRHGRDTRVVIDLSDAVRARSFMLGPSGEHGYRLVLDLYGGAAQPAAPGARITQREPTPATTQPAERRLAAANSQSADTTAGTGRPAAASPEPTTETRRTGRHSAASSTPVASDRPAGRDIIVAIDAGHGGRDPGAVGPTGLTEKTITLAIARRLKAMVDEQPHMKGVLTRKTDRYIGLRERMVIAREEKADFFVSIHCDASPRGSNAEGASVYTLSANGATSEHARWLAKRENEADLVGGTSLKDANSSLASFVLDLSQSASIEASLDAGERVLGELGELGGLHKSRVQQAGFVVLKSPDIPSILVETNFISHPRAEKRLATAGYQKELAGAILRGVKGYFARYRPSTYITSAQVYEVQRGDTLSEIAERFGTTMEKLRERNDLHGNQLRVGQELEIGLDTSQQLASRQ